MSLSTSGGGSYGKPLEDQRGSGSMSNCTQGKMGDVDIYSKMAGDAE